MRHDRVRPNPKAAPARRQPKLVPSTVRHVDANAILWRGAVDADLFLFCLLYIRHCDFKDISTALPACKLLHAVAHLLTHSFTINGYVDAAGHDCAGPFLLSMGGPAHSGGGVRHLSQLARLEVFSTQLGAVASQR